MAFHVYIDLRKEGYGQYLSTTCWYASYRMLYQWSERSQISIPSKLEKAGLKWSQLKLRGLLDSEFKRAAGALGMGGWSGETLRSYSSGSIAHILKKYGPMWVAMNWQGEEEAGHAVVIGGYDGDGDVFKVYNPYNPIFAGVVDTGWLEPGQLKAWIKRVPFAAQVCV